MKRELYTMNENSTHKNDDFFVYETNANLARS